MLDLRKIMSPKIRGKLMYGLSFLPDKPYLRLFYFSTTGKFLHFRNPKGYCEKLQWLKIYDKHPEYRDLTDKLAVRNRIEKVLGPGYTFPLLGKWKHFDDIDFNQLPEQFVLKCNHDSGSTRVIRSKAELTPEKIQRFRASFEASLKEDFSLAGREYSYHGIEPYIFAEPLMIDEQNPEKSIEDYKFFCFDGVPKLMFVATDRATDCRFDFFDMDFNHLDIVNIHPQADKPIPKPDKFEEMKVIAAKLSQGIKHVRIDLYELNGKVYFGEYTFFHGGGFRLFEPPEWERRLGDWIDLRNLAKARKN